MNVDKNLEGSKQVIPNDGQSKCLHMYPTSNKRWYALRCAHLFKLGLRVVTLMFVISVRTSLYATGLNYVIDRVLIRTRVQCTRRLDPSGRKSYHYLGSRRLFWLVKPRLVIDEGAYQYVCMYVLIETRLWDSTYPRGSICRRFPFTYSLLFYSPQTTISFPRGQRQTLLRGFRGDVGRREQVGREQPLK